MGTCYFFFMCLIDMNILSEAIESVLTQCISVWYNNATNQDCKALQGVVRLAERILWRFSTAWYGTVRHGSVRYGTAHFGSVAFPPQFSTAIEWAGLFTRRYNCAASTAVTSS